MARSYMGGPPVMNYMPSPANTSQGPTMGNPMGRPASMGAYSTSMAPQNNPGNPMYTPGPAQQKGYPGGIDQAMMGFSVPGPPMQIQPQPSGGPGSHYDYRPHMIEASSYGIKRSASFQNKMTPLTSENFLLICKAKEQWVKTLVATLLTYIFHHIRTHAKPVPPHTRFT